MFPHVVQSAAPAGLRVTRFTTVSLGCYTGRMKLTVVGSADAFNASGRGHSCYLVQSEGAGALMVDFGPTALRGLRTLSVHPNQIDGIAFTHLHGDHIGGFPFLFLDALYNSVRKRELPILGPVLTEQTLEALLEATYDDAKQHLGKLPVSFNELAPGETRTFCGYRITGFAADHMQLPHRPLCLRIVDPAGKSIAFSGDTLPCPGLFEAGDGADLLVAECTRVTQPAGHHCTWDDWKREIPRLGARRLMLTHLGADVRERLPGLADDVRADIPIEFADDGLVREL
jgi:ribonuclease BN (tRNA processing enzyme)